MSRAAAPDPVPAPVEAFIARWSAASLSERAHAQLFLAELCDVLAVPRPDPVVRKELAENPQGLPPDALKASHRRAVEQRIESERVIHTHEMRAMLEREGHEEKARLAASALPPASTLDKILRYETALERQLYRAMHQLERLQRRRQGEAVPAPVALEVSSAG